jgi:hypothetical protein
VLIIWGFKTYVDRLATLLLPCARHGAPAAHHVDRYGRKFTLFWIPLWRTRTQHVVTCTYCGLESPVPQQEAERLVAMATQQVAPTRPPLDQTAGQQHDYQ